MPDSAAAPESAALPEPAATGAVPLSRRAAREAAARAQEPQPTADADSAVPAPANPVAPANEPHAPVSTSTLAHPDSWIFGSTDTAPASSVSAYARKGQAAAAPATASAAVKTPPSTTLDELFTTPTVKGAAVQAQSEKRRRHTGAWIALGIVLVLLAGAAGGGLWAWNTYESKIREFMGWEEPKDYAAGLAHGEALVTIASGDIPSTISTTLHTAGVTKTSGAFYDMLIKTGQNPVFYPGVYKLQKQMSSTDALAALQDPANKIEHSALLPEGLTVAQSLPKLADSLGIPLADFQTAVANPADYGVSADTLEGWLFPAMYTFDPGVTAKDVVKVMVDRTVQSLDAAGVPVADRQRILTIASIVQREARLKDDFYKVSRVIANRLAQGWQLQMDSTAQYGYGEMHDGTVSSSAAALADDNAWNTYKIPGLPIGPIANPGDVAIDAAMHPADGPWMFFVTWNLDTGETIFSTTDAEHEQAKQKWIAWCKANPDGGC